MIAAASIVALFAISAAMLLNLYRLAVGPDVLDRVLALDTLVLVLVGLLALWSASEGVSYFLDAALALAVLGFLGTLAAARFYGEGRVF